MNERFGQPDIFILYINSNNGEITSWPRGSNSVPQVSSNLIHCHVFTVCCNQVAVAHAMHTYVLLSLRSVPWPPGRGAQPQAGSLHRGVLSFILPDKSLPATPGRLADA